MTDVDLNASAILTVRRIVPAPETNASTHALEPVDRMLIVMYLIINRLVHVALVSEVIRIHSVLWNDKKIVRLVLFICFQLYRRLHIGFYIIAPIPSNPCHPSPCGPNSQCRERDGQAICSCLPTFVGSPPVCRPECVTNSECPLDKTCINQKCANPCVGMCGTNAYCRVHNHSPICVCNSGYAGDPFTRCNRPPRKTPI